MANIFDIIKSITYEKKEWNDLSEDEKNSMNNYMCHRIISMGREYVEITNTIQKNIRLTPEQCYIVYKELIPKKYVFLKYKKAKSNKINNELLEILSKYWECSQREVKENLNILSNESIKNILISLGKSDKEIEKLLE